MAFLSKLGNILKQTNGNGSLSSPSLFQALRCMSSSKLFIGGIEYGMDEDSLREAFSKYGEVIETRVILDRETGRSRGFGFVTFTSAEEASSAIQALDGQDLHGRILKVYYAHDRTSGGGGGGYGGGAGNYGGNTGSYGGRAGGNLGNYEGRAGNHGGNLGHYEGRAGIYGGNLGNYGGCAGDYGGDYGSYGGNYGGNTGRYEGGGYGGGVADGDGYGSSGSAYAEGSTANAGSAGGYNGSSSYGSGNTYGRHNGVFFRDNRFGANPVSNISQFGGDNTQFGVGGE